MAKIKQRMKNDDRGYIYNGYYQNGKNSDDSGDDIDLPVRKKYNPQHFIEAQVQDGDTLQAIALKFNCSVSQLMRVNNLLRENEIFAKRTLRIPVTAYSLLTEGLPAVHTSGTNSPTRNKQVSIENSSFADPTKVSTNEFQQKLMVASVNSTVIDNLLLSNASNDALRSLPSTSAQVSYSVNNIPSDSEEIYDQKSVLLPKRAGSKTSVEAVLINEFTSKGADLGIKWLHLLVFILVLVVIIPLVYVLYIAEHPEKYLHHSA